ncbi:hypothetical protein, partial [Streptomyces sp. NPDC058401]|uniref:hypothetical protein n=1 Tax=Streptomyces sp. NPDC058401 TaxID=3346480 RepID=UPI00365DA6F9
FAYWAYVVASAVRPGAAPDAAGPARSERDGLALGGPLRTVDTSHPINTAPLAQDIRTLLPTLAP